MGIRFEGEFEVERTRQDTFDFLSDPEKFGPLLPGFEEVEADGEHDWTLKLKVGVSQIKGAATVKLHLEESQPPERAYYSGKGKLVAGSVKVKAGFDLEETKAGTQVKWHGEIQVFGRLASLGGGLLKPLARKNIQKLIDSLQEALAS